MSNIRRHPWGDSEFINHIDGRLSLYSPIAVLFYCSVLKMDVIVGLRGPFGQVDLTIQKGRIVGCKGLQDLLVDLKINGLPGVELGDLFGMAISRGIQPDQVMTVAATNLGLFLASIVQQNVGIKDKDFSHELPH